MTPKQTVAILGSCVSRDIFIRKTNPTYKDNFELVLFQNHTTLLSLFSPAIKYENKDFSHLSERNLQMIKNELDKTFLSDLKKIQPDILIIDFFSEIFFDTIKDSDSYLTVNIWKTTDTKHYNRISKLNKPFTPNLTTIQVLISKLSSFLKKELPNTTIILNKTKTVDKYINAAGTVSSFKNQKELNNRWKIVDEMFEAINKPFIINLKHSFIADYHHIWGLSNVHYEAEYYIHSLEQIKELKTA